jgi:hypothetical protein
MGKAWGSIGEITAFSKIAEGDDECFPVNTFKKPSLLAVAVYRAFYEHYPLKLNPNVIWLTIAQGFTHYVDDNKEEVRSKFVTFEGKKQLIVLRPNFT